MNACGNICSFACDKENRFSRETEVQRLKCCRQLELFSLEKLFSEEPRQDSAGKPGIDAGDVEFVLKLKRRLGLTLSLHFFRIQLKAAS